MSHYLRYFLFLTAIIPAFSQTPTTIQLNSFPNPAVYGHPVTITATVSPSAAQGKVTFYNGATVLGTQTLTSGQATLTTTLLPAGKGTLKAFYLGSTGYLTSTSAALPLTVNTLPAASLSLANGSPTPAGYYPEPLVFGDFNGDGKLDMALAGLQESAGAVFILLGDGNGNFTPASGSPIMVGGLPRSLAMADFNGDSIPDLVTSDSQGTGVTVLLGDGQGSFTIASGSPFVSGSDPFSVAVGDFNGDGNVDLAVGNYFASANNVNIFLGDGTGRFTTAPGSPFSAGNSVSFIAVADFNGDGNSDLATSNALDNTVTIMLGNGSGGFSPSPASPFPTCPETWLLAAADFNEDGKPDLAIACGVGGGGTPPPHMTVLIQDTNGDGGFTQPTGSPYPVGGNGLATGDFNGDGHLDIVATDNESGTISVLSGDGTGKFAPALGSPIAVNQGEYFVAAGDVNGDGLADIGVVAEVSSVVDVFLGAPGSTVQNIAFPALPAQVLGSAPFTISASASSGLPITFSTADSTICTVDGSTVALIAAGTCSITATQPGNATFIPAAPVTVSFTIRAPLTDLSGDNATFIAAIDAILSKGITSGCTTSGYCPSQNLTRGEMAVFIIRSIYGSNNFTYNPTPWFTDTVDTPFFKYIQKMKELGITSGCGGQTYCPNDNVTRAEMAVFIIRARYGANYNFDYSPSPYFTDAVSTPADPSYTAFFRYIQRLRQDNITAGCTATTFCPNDIVTRDQVAVFLSRAAFNNLLPPTTPFIAGVTPSTAGLTDTVNVAITGVNTNFVQGTTRVGPQPGFTIESVTVNSPTSLTAQLLIGSTAPLGPESIVAITGTEEAVAPNAFTITSDPAPGAIAWFSGDGNNINAISGLTATAFGTVAYASALSRTQGIQDALAFNMIGFASYLRLFSETATVTGPRTFVAWVNPSEAGAGGQPIVTGGQDFTAYDTLGITPTYYCATAGPYHLYLYHGGTCYLSNLTLAPNTWSMVAVTFDGTNAVFYVNGVASVPVPAQMYNYALSTFEIGGDVQESIFGATGASFQGLLNEVQIYNRALTPAEIQGLYQP